MNPKHSAREAGFDHERLEVYSTALAFVSLASDMIIGLPKGRSALGDQLERAATSVALNTAEGSGEFSRKEKVRFYRMALRSVSECAAILDVGQRMRAVSSQRHAKGKSLLNRIAAMLLALIHRMEQN